MKLYSDICLHLSMFLADRAHFLYLKQLQPYPLLRRTPNSVFHEFVLVSRIDKDDNRERAGRYILLVGAPWFLKGADVLIKAFLTLASDFPDVKLKILGFYPDHEGMDKLVGGSSQIEIIQVLPHPETLKLIEGATIMVAPSRCEGLSRALVEGMAAGIPLVGSDVGGIPTLVRDGENGFLIPSGDDQTLGRRLRQLLDDGQLRRRMGESGYARAHTELDEENYVRLFAQMVKDTVSGLGG